MAVKCKGHQEVCNKGRNRRLELSIQEDWTLGVLKEKKKRIRILFLLMAVFLFSSYGLLP